MKILPKHSLLQVLLFTACLLPLQNTFAQGSCDSLLEVASCNDLVNVTIDSDCEVVFTADMGLEGDFECYNQLEVTVDGGQAGSWSGLGAATITDAGNHTGEPLVYTVSDLRNGNHCWGTVKLENKTEPTI